MVGVGMLMILFVLIGIVFVWKKKFVNVKWYLCFMILMIGFLFLVNFMGWIMIEIG